MITYGSRGSETPEFEDIVESGNRQWTARENPNGVAGASVTDASLPRFAVAGCSSQPQPSDRDNLRAAYGEWNSLLEDSSDVDMDAGGSSSRGSSVTRDTPPGPSIRAVPGPQMDPQPGPSSRPPEELEPERSWFYSQPSRNVAAGAQGSTPRGRGPPLPRRQPVRSSAPTPAGRPGSRLGTDGPPPSALSRRKTTVIELSSSSDSSDRSEEEDADGTAGTHKVQKAPQLPLPRSDAVPRNVRRVGLSTSTGLSLSSRPAPSDTSRERRSAGRSARTSNPARNTRSSPDGREDRVPEAASLGYTVRIPKPDFARARRLLVPNARSKPMAAILMRGEAYFIDQRRKCVAVTSPSFHYSQH